LGADGNLYHSKVTIGTIVCWVGDKKKNLGTGRPQNRQRGEEEENRHSSHCSYEKSPVHALPEAGGREQFVRKRNEVVVGKVAALKAGPGTLHERNQSSGRALWTACKDAGLCRRLRGIGSTGESWFPPRMRVEGSGGSCGPFGARLSNTSADLDRSDGGGSSETGKDLLVWTQKEKPTRGGSNHCQHGAPSCSPSGCSTGGSRVISNKPIILQGSIPSAL